MSFTWIYVWVVLIFIAAFARLFIAVVTSAPRKKDGRGETGKTKTERRTGAKRSKNLCKNNFRFLMELKEKRVK